MTADFGPGVSRVLEPAASGFQTVIWQEGRCPTDAELNYLQQSATEWQRLAVLRGTPSGWLGNAINSRYSFSTNPIWSNWFKFGQQRIGAKQSVEWAVVNGWLIPVSGTRTGTPPGSPNDVDTWNLLALDPPPSNSGDTRIDFAFLEVWLARVAPNPSTANKPSASGIWKYGNVEGGYTFLPDDLQDPSLGFETTQRVQVQYRIRVVSGLLGLATYPDGFDPTLVKGQGAAAAPTAYTFTNMRNELGDPGLWRAGDGTPNALGTVDGYVYAIPLCSVFRRNSVAWDGDPSQNINGGFSRNPTAVDRTGYKTFANVPHLTAPITAAAVSLTLDTVTDIALPLTPLTPVYVKIGDEILTYSVITGTTMTVVARGQLGTKAETHVLGEAVTVLSQRPDGLFSDQIAITDILDMRHSVNPNGFDYNAVLMDNLDKLLRNDLRANWKRSGGGPQGTFVFYQDKISNSPAALGITKLDGPDGIRMIFSDAASSQPVEVICEPPPIPGPAVNTTATWGLSISSTTNHPGASVQFDPGDVITIPISQFKNGVAGSDADQIRFVSTPDTLLSAGAIEIRVDGQPQPLVENVDYVILAAIDPTANMVITLLPGYIAHAGKRLYVTLRVLYGPGRGLSRRPTSLHSFAYLNFGTDILAQQAGIPANNTPMRVGWAPLWSKFRAGAYLNQLPLTAEGYADPGSKTLVLTPFRSIDLPDVLSILDGVGVHTDTSIVSTGNNGSTPGGGNTLSDLTANFVADGVVQGDIVNIAAPPAEVGTYLITAPPTPTSITTNHVFGVVGGGIVYEIHHTQDLMPLNDSAGNIKWATTDPLGLFRGTTDPTANTRCLFVPLPRHLVPGWGEVRVPIIHTDTSTFPEGVNYMALSLKGNPVVTWAPGDRNFIAFSNGGLTYVPFSTIDLGISLPAVYNATFSYSGSVYVGIRFFVDTKGLNRKGLELPPFYGIARLFAVYEAQDYKTNGSSYDATTRNFVSGKATNLLRQNFDGATFWIEVDDDGDATFVLNAEAIDLTKSPNPIASFETGNYVIEANLFGFDRGSFNLDSTFRMVLTRYSVLDGVAADLTRTNNYGDGTSSTAALPKLVIPAPANAADEVAINYSRTPYQGDAWGSQTVQQDIGHFPGPLTSGTAYQIASTELDETALTRPNQKPLEVLAASAFATTLGTGRISSDLGLETDFRNVGWEEVSNYPPTSPIDPRPGIYLNALDSEETSISLGTEYHGCTEALPMGALYRDKDFRGGFINGAGAANFHSAVRAPLAYNQSRAPSTTAAGTARTLAYEQTEVLAHTVSLVSGQPGEIVVQVDGEAGNYGLLTNFRTHRGGSVFSASHQRPGGEFSNLAQNAGPHPAAARVLAGVAMLVRNYPTAVGATEVSAGSELLMLVCTTVQQLKGSEDTPLAVLLGTNGTGEGASAADLYRVEGRPLVKDNVRLNIDPSSIILSKRSD